MTRLPLAILALALGVAPTLAQPQQSPAAGNASAAALQQMPEQCRKMFQQNQQAQWMQNMPMMQGRMPPLESTGMGGSLPEANRDYMEAMRKMNPPMMAGMMIQDPDIAFLCTMIVHHQGGVDMARAVIEHGKNDEVKKKAEQTLEEQERDIRKLTELLEKHAK